MQKRCMGHRAPPRRCSFLFAASSACKRSGTSCSHVGACSSVAMRRHVSLSCHGGCVGDSACAEARCSCLMGL
jgi:hypothetical protein